MIREGENLLSSPELHELIEGALTLAKGGDVNSSVFSLSFSIVGSRLYQYHVAKTHEAIDTIRTEGKPVNEFHALERLAFSITVNEDDGTLWMVRRAQQEYLRNPGCELADQNGTVTSLDAKRQGA